MAIKVSTTTVIDNSLGLQNIASMDSATQTQVNNAIAAQSNVLSIYDSGGNVVRTFYCAVAAS